MKEPQMARRLQIGTCDRRCGNVHIDLQDKSGRVFAAAQIDPDTAADMAEELFAAAAKIRAESREATH